MNVIQVMEINNASDEKTECDSITALELQKSKRILYFSDGILEEFSESDGEDVGPDITDRVNDPEIQVSTLPWGPRIKYQAYQIGSRLWYGVEYIGEGLASFFGITNPKYISDSDIENASKNDLEANNMDSISHNNEGCGWHHNNNVNSPNIDVMRFTPNTENSTTP